MSISAVMASVGPQMMSGASTYAPASQKMSNLFEQIDTSGSGTITQAQFNQAFQTLNPPGDFKAQGAAAVWAQLDPTNSGSVNKQDFVTAMTSLMKQMRGHHHHGATQTSASPETPSQTVAASNNALTNALAGSKINTLA
jgi:EF-hand domain pair